MDNDKEMEMEETSTSAEDAVVNAMDIQSHRDRIDSMVVGTQDVVGGDIFAASSQPEQNERISPSNGHTAISASRDETEEAVDTSTISATGAPHPPPHSAAATTDQGNDESECGPWKPPLWIMSSLTTDSKGTGKGVGTTGAGLAAMAAAASLSTTTTNPTVGVTTTHAMKTGPSPSTTNHMEQSHHTSAVSAPTAIMTTTTTTTTTTTSSSGTAAIAPTTLGGLRPHPSFRITIPALWCETDRIQSSRDSTGTNSHTTIATGSTTAAAARRNHSANNNNNNNNNNNHASSTKSTTTHSTLSSSSHRVVRGVLEHIRMRQRLEQPLLHEQRYWRMGQQELVELEQQWQISCHRVQELQRKKQQGLEDIRHAREEEWSRFWVKLEQSLRDDFENQQRLRRLEQERELASEIEQRKRQLRDDQEERRKKLKLEHETRQLPTTLANMEEPKGDVAKESDNIRAAIKELEKQQETMNDQRSEMIWLLKQVIKAEEKQKAARGGGGSDKHYEPKTHASKQA